MNSQKFKVLGLFFVGSMAIAIVYFNFYNGSKKLLYTFERKFSNQETFRTSKISFLADGASELNPIVTDDTLLYTLTYEKNSLNKNFSLQSYDYSLKKNKLITLDIPKNSHILFANGKYTIYTSFFDLYIHHNEEQTNSEVNLKGLKVFSLYPLVSKGNFICIGELVEAGKFKTGFFVIDIYNQKVINTISVLEINQTTFAPQNKLKFSGKFTGSRDASQIVFYCDKYSGVFITDQNGANFKSYFTNDNTPLPQIVNNSKEAFFYKRGATWGANYGFFVIKDNYYVFSARSSVKDSLVADIYSKSGFKYLNSIKLYSKGKKSSDINNVYFDGKQIIIAFSRSFLSFIYSR